MNAPRTTADAMRTVIEQKKFLEKCLGVMLVIDTVHYDPRTEIMTMNWKPFSVKRAVDT